MVQETAGNHGVERRSGEWQKARFCRLDLDELAHTRLFNISPGRLDRAGRPINGGEPDVAPARTDFDGNSRGPGTDVEHVEAFSDRAFGVRVNETKLSEEFVGERAIFKVTSEAAIGRVAGSAVLVEIAGEHARQCRCEAVALQRILPRRASPVRFPRTSRLTPAARQPIVSRMVNSQFPLASGGWAPPRRAVVPLVLSYASPHSSRQRQKRPARNLSRAVKIVSLSKTVVYCFSAPEEASALAVSALPASEPTAASSPSDSTVASKLRCF